MASHLHLPVQEVKQKTSSLEFVDWMEYLERDWNVPSRHDYYLAQITEWLVKVNLGKKDAKKIKLKDFILEFGVKKRKKKMNLRERAKASKMFWMGLIGLSRKK